MPFLIAGFKQEEACKHQRHGAIAFHGSVCTPSLGHGKGREEGRRTTSLTPPHLPRDVVRHPRNCWASLSGPGGPSTPG